MWDTAYISDVHLSHDMQCARCGHDVHTFLACGADCAASQLSCPGPSQIAAPRAPLPAHLMSPRGR